MTEFALQSRLLEENEKLKGCNSSFTMRHSKKMGLPSEKAKGRGKI